MAASLPPLMNLLMLTLAILVAIRGGAHADDIRLPDEQLCSPSNATCSLVLLTCPVECPQRGTVVGSACEIDCGSCQVSCKRRLPDCFGFGSVCYDPRFTGRDGVAFYFHGQKDEDFCLLSDRSLHINAHFIGHRPASRPRDYTWVQSLGILFASHELSLGAKRVSTWENDVDQFNFTMDGEDFSVATGEGVVWSSSDGEVIIERTARTNGVRLVINQLMEALVTVVPITKEENRVHNYQLTEEDCYAHLHLQFIFFQLSSAVHGVLGQTYKPGYKTPVNVRAPMPILRGEEMYRTYSLLSPDCKVSQFVLPSRNDEHLDVKEQEGGEPRKARNTSEDVEMRQKGGNPTHLI